MTSARARLALVLGAGLVLTGCASGDTAAGPAASEAAARQPVPTATASAAEVPTTPAAEVPTVPADAGHLHGMGIDPADGTVYLGTHAGLMAVHADGVHRVGEATTDLMGFAVAGPQHYYASGHPGAGEDLPNPVGLIETTDGGLTWQPLSLGGTSDFHALAAGAGRVYGYDGRIRSTDDGRSWTDGAQDVRPASLAVQPGGPGTVVATTEHGLVRSDDGGQSFAHVDGAPLLVLLSWTSADALWGVAPDGSVHVSADRGVTWTERGNAGGPPEALTASEEGAVVVATEREIVRSDDGGRTYSTIARKG